MVVVCHELYLVGVWHDGNAVAAVTAPKASVKIGFAFFTFWAAALILTLVSLKKLIVTSYNFLIIG